MTPAADIPGWFFTENLSEVIAGDADADELQPPARG
jgi:hypothetical protein